MHFLPAFSRQETLRPIIIAALAAATLWVYWPVQDYPFVNYDDAEYVYDNPRVQSGLTPDNILWAFRSTQAGNWHPVTWLSLMLDHELFGNNPGGYHITNLCLHLVNAILLFVVLLNITGALWRSALVAFLFALHPLHVESVAWVSERKDLLCACFMFLCLWTYGHYVKQQRPGLYGGTLLYFVLGLMAKPMLVTLPFVLLLLDYWPLGRFSRRAAKNTAPASARAGGSASRVAWQLILEKIPFLLLTIAACCITLYAQKESVAHCAAGSRIANAVLSYAGYLLHTVWPVHLAFLYPFRSTIPFPLVALSILVLGAISFASAKTLVRAPWFLVGWLWFLGTLVPVIGIIQVGEQAMADRYTYVPLIGVFMIIAWEAARFVSGKPFRKSIVAACAVVTLAALSVVARQQVGNWRDSVALFRHALAVTRDNHVAHNNLGKVFYEQNQLDSSLHHLSMAIGIVPTYSIALYNVGSILKQQGKPGEALPYLQKAVESDSIYTYALVCLAETYELLGNDSSAEIYYRKAIASHGDCFTAWYRLAIGMYNRNCLDSAIACLDTVLGRWPNTWGAHYYLGLALSRKNNINGSSLHFSEAIRLNPTSWMPYAAFGEDLSKRGHFAGAIQLYTMAVRLVPDSLQPRLDRAIAFTLENKLDSAIADYRLLLRLKPEFADAHFYLGQVYERINMRDSALFHFREAVRISPTNSEFSSRLHGVAGPLRRKGTNPGDAGR